MKAILFPGQGSQIVGMGSEFYNNFPSVKKLFEEEQSSTTTFLPLKDCLQKLMKY